MLRKRWENAPEAAVQVEASNHPLLRLRGVVVSKLGKGRARTLSCEHRGVERKRTAVDVSKLLMVASRPEVVCDSWIRPRGTCLLLGRCCRCPACPSDCISLGGSRCWVTVSLPQDLDCFSGLVGFLQCPICIALRTARDSGSSLSGRMRQPHPRPIQPRWYSLWRFAEEFTEPSPSQIDKSHRNRTK